MEWKWNENCTPQWCVRTVNVEITTTINANAKAIRTRELEELRERGVLSVDDWSMHPGPIRDALCIFQQKREANLKLVFGLSENWSVILYHYYSLSALLWALVENCSIDQSWGLAEFLGVLLSMPNRNNLQPLSASSAPLRRSLCLVRLVALLVLPPLS